MTNPTTEDRIAQFIKIHVQMGTPFKSIAAGVIRLIETQPVSVEDERIAAMENK
jgi:hypothetical protein